MTNPSDRRAAVAEERDWSAEIGVLVQRVDTFYLYREVAERVSVRLRERLAAGAYRRLTDEQTFADVVTDDMQSINADPHLFLQYSSQEIAATAEPTVGNRDAGNGGVDQGGVDQGARRGERAALDAFGFTRVQRLAGNVGLLELSNFYDPAVSGAGMAATAAMNLLASADALVIDLRGNTGGEPEMVALIAGYLFDERTHLVDLHFPADDRTEQLWTGYRSGPVFGGRKPIDVLISPQTFSAAESFSYLLQQAGRATLIGEATQGGPVTFHYPYRVSAHFYCAVPSGYPIDPRSGTNWQGGVQPDLAVPAAHAFEVAYRRALEHVVTLGTDGARARVTAAARSALLTLSTLSEDLSDSSE